MTGLTSADESAISAGSRVTWVGLICNIILFVLKLWGGIVGRSQALVADAVHSVSDLFSDVVVLVGLKWGRQPADEEHPFGHGRIETIAGLVVGLTLLAVGLGIAYNAILSIYRHTTSSPSLLAIYIAALSILVKEALYWYTIITGRRINSMAVIANAWHHRSDALSSVAVLLGVGAAYFNPEWHLADAFAALLVSFFLLKVSASLSWTAFRELADTAPSRELLDGLESHAREIKGVRDVHDIRARQSGPDVLVELHIVVDHNITVEQGHAIAKEVEARLHANIKDVHRVIIHVDPDLDDHRRPSVDGDGQNDPL